MGLSPIAAQTDVKIPEGYVTPASFQCGCATNEELVEAHAILFDVLWFITI